jgi:prevent-host-death family protein
MTDNGRSEPSSNIWTLADAEALFSEIIDRAQTRPQVITRHGHPCAVLVSAEEWARRTARKGTLADFLLASPLRQDPMDIERVRDRPRDIEL